MEKQVSELAIIILALGAAWLLLRRANTVGNGVAPAPTADSPYDLFARTDMVERAANDPTYFLYYNAPQTDVQTIDVPFGKTQLFQTLATGDTTFISNKGTLFAKLAPSFPGYLSNAAGALPE